MPYDALQASCSGAPARPRDLSPAPPPPTSQRSADTMLYDVLKVFRFGRSHMSALTRPGAGGRAEVVGVITVGGRGVPAGHAVCLPQEHACCFLTTRARMLFAYHKSILGWRGRLLGGGGHPRGGWACGWQAAECDHQVKVFT